MLNIEPALTRCQRPINYRDQPHANNSKPRLLALSEQALLGLLHPIVPNGTSTMARQPVGRTLVERCSAVSPGHGDFLRATKGQRVSSGTISPGGICHRRLPAEQNGSIWVLDWNGSLN